jgi:hypothetical protein
LSAIGSKQIVERQGLSPFILCDRFPRQTPDHIAFLAKLRFQASSSANDARIWDAIASCSSGGNALTLSSALSSSEDMP